MVWARQRGCRIRDAVSTTIRSEGRILTSSSRKRQQKSPAATFTDGVELIEADGCLNTEDDSPGSTVCESAGRLHLFAQPSRGLPAGVADSRVEAHDG